jgi:hypothetical protein
MQWLLYGFVVVAGALNAVQAGCNTVSKVLFRKHLELSPYFRSDGVLLEFKPATA